MLKKIYEGKLNQINEQRVIRGDKFYELLKNVEIFIN